MKRRMTHVIMALSLIAALAVSLVVEYHHHDADGSMCLGFSCHADCHNHSHESDQPCDEDGCGVHLDCFCCDGHHHHVAVPAPDFHALLTAAVSVPEINEDIVKGYGSIFCERRVPRPLLESRALRAPPVDNYA